MSSSGKGITKSKKKKYVVRVHRTSEVPLKQSSFKSELKDVGTFSPEPIYSSNRFKSENTASVEFNVKQQQFIKAPLDRNILVQAPPGTGKTHCLVERLKYLIENLEEDDSPSSITVLSFSRAAVKEISKRIQSAVDEGARDALRFVNLRTFDSYATWILNDGNYDLEGLGYDDRIELLIDELKGTCLIQNNNRIDQTRWLLVDEVQDLVLQRRTMVSQMMWRVVNNGGSFMLLGDSNQAINDYQIKGNNTNVKFIDFVKKYTRPVDYLELDRTYRYENSPLMKKYNRDARKILDSRVETVKDRMKQLIELIPDDNPKINLEQLKDRLISDSSSAVLCRTNIQVQQIGTWLEKNGVSVQILRKKKQADWPCWIAMLFSGYRQQVMSVITLEKRYQQLTSVFMPDFNEIKQFLIKNEVMSGDIVNIEQLVWKIGKSGQIPEREKKTDIPLISTIHKSKGLEYNNVFIIDPSKVNNEEELRVFYVALSRAKKSLQILEKDKNYLESIKENKEYHESAEDYIFLNNCEDFDISPLEDRIYDNRRIEFCLRNLTEYHPENPNGNFFIRKNQDKSYSLFFSSDAMVLKIFNLNYVARKHIDKYFWRKNIKPEDVNIVINHMKPIYFTTIIHPQKTSFIKRILGDQCFLRIPFFEGFYKIEK